MYVEEVAYTYVRNPQRNSKGFSASCPICNEGRSGSRKRRFNFFSDTHSAYCFNAGCPLNSGGASDLRLTAMLKGISQSEENAEYIRWFNRNSGRVNTARVNDAIDAIGGPPTDEDNRNGHGRTLSSLTANKDTLFEDSWVDLPPTVRQYCEGRRMFDAPFSPEGWKLYFCTSTKRLVIPWMEDGSMSYYQKRALLRGDDPKYIYPSSTSRPIFNVDMVDMDFPYVFCTEGAIDCCFLKNGIACGGLVPSSDQREYLRERFPGFTVVILTDNQWSDRSAMMKLNGQNGVLRTSSEYMYFIWPKGIAEKDINECACSGNRLCHFDDPGWLRENSYDALQAKFLLNY